LARELAVGIKRRLDKMKVRYRFIFWGEFCYSRN